MPFPGDLSTTARGAEASAFLDHPAVLSCPFGTTLKQNRDHSWNWRLTLAEFGGDDRLPARLGVFREVILHASLDTTAAGLNT